MNVLKESINSSFAMVYEDSIGEGLGKGLRPDIFHWK